MEQWDQRHMHLASRVFLVGGYLQAREQLMEGGFTTEEQVSAPSKQSLEAPPLMQKLSVCLETGMNPSPRNNCL